tara:strand:+ start:1143 stop:2465 length:1323 start_codon:yes stop_codon:yes gene_type:complete
MNVYDSDRISNILLGKGYVSSATPENADLIILNTCHIREKASEKVFSDLGRLRKIKNDKAKDGKKVLLAVGGCVAQAEGNEIVERAPYVDMVFGPHTYHKLPSFIDKLRVHDSPIVDIGVAASNKFSYGDLKKQTVNVSSFLTIQEGCNKFCTFCVVPYTRGIEVSRPVEDLVKEARLLVNNGTKEIILLGQNVNAYHGLNKNSKEVGLDYLIKSIANIDGLKRIRFTTSHPLDMSIKIIESFKSVSKLMPMLHLPVQSGSNHVLKLMNRRHTVEDYIEIVERLRDVVPNIALSSDFIVGFPGESKKDFEQTIELVEKIKFSQSFSFKYSQRPGTPASSSSNQIEEKIKKSRLKTLQNLLNMQQENFNSKFIGKDVAVLFEKETADKGNFFGRSEYLQSVHVKSDVALVGSVKDVNIFASGMKSLLGILKKDFYDVNHGV